MTTEARAPRAPLYLLRAMIPSPDGTCLLVLDIHGAVGVITLPSLRVTDTWSLEQVVNERENDYNVTSRDDDAEMMGVLFFFFLLLFYPCLSSVNLSFPPSFSPSFSPSPPSSLHAVHSYLLYYVIVIVTSLLRVFLSLLYLI